MMSLCFDDRDALLSLGEITLYIAGSPVISVDGLSLRTSEEVKFMGMHFQTFFGGAFVRQPIIVHFDCDWDWLGHTGDWASSKDQRAWFADVTGVIVE